METDKKISDTLNGVSLDDKKEELVNCKGTNEVGFGRHAGVCAICLSNIVLQETALVKGCEHAYCVKCILRWATYKEICPQCKNPFQFLYVHRSLDGSINDFMFEESVCLLLRAAWFEPLVVEDRPEVYDDLEEYYQHQYYEDDDDQCDMDSYFSSSSSRRIGNRRWGDNGYVRAGRQEARPTVHKPNTQNNSGGAGSSREPSREVGQNKTGRRAKRTLKREEANKAAAASKHDDRLHN